MFDKKTKAQALIDSEWTASCVQHLEILFCLRNFSSDKVLENLTSGVMFIFSSLKNKTLTADLHKQIFHPWQIV